MPLFFVLTLLSAFWSHNGREASTAIEVKLGFLVFPYLLFGFKWPIEILKRCLVGFVSGCFFACVYLLIRATWYASNGQPDYFYYTLFSDFIHASYFAMYLTTAIAIVILYYPRWFVNQTSRLYLAYGFVAVFILCIFLCASKLGIIGFFVTLPLILISRFKIPITVKTTLWMLALLVVCITLTTFLFPSVFDRLRSITEVQHETIDKTSVESTRVRVLIWKEAIGIIRANPWIGVGVGDANDALYAAYEKEGLTGALSHKFNAHNQFFQTFIGMGLPGFILLCMLTFWQVVVAIQKKKSFTPGVCHFNCAQLFGGKHAANRGRGIVLRILLCFSLMHLPPKSGTHENRAQDSMLNDVVFVHQSPKHFLFMAHRFALCFNRELRRTQTQSFSRRFGFCHRWTNQ